MGELSEISVVKEDLTTAADGKAYRTRLYRLEAILAVGFRVRSARGIQFRQWATTTLREYHRKGFVINAERLKDPAGFDYFDELLERIRDIRASEKCFYQLRCGTSLPSPAPATKANPRPPRSSSRPFKTKCFFP